MDAFNKLAAISGIEFTGAAKILHLLRPQLFVMWDRAIMGWSPPLRDYAKLDIIKRGFWEKRTFKQAGSGYFDFLAVCQEKFCGLTSPDARKSLAKCIDEFNFCTITVPLAAMRKKEPEA